MLHFTALNVSVPRLWLHRHDAKGNQFTLFSEWNSVADNRIVTGFQRMKSGKRDCWRCISPNGFEDNITGQFMHLP